MTPESLMPRRLQRHRILIPVGISVVTLAGLGVAVDGKSLSQILHQVDPVLLILAALKTPILVLIWSLRWHLLLRARQFSVSLSRTTVAVLIRSFFNALTPGAGTGGEPFGAYYLAKRTSLTFKEAIASTAAERMAQGLVMVGIVLIALVVCLPMLPLSSTLSWVLLIGMVGFMMFVGSMFYLSLFQFRYCRFIIEAVIRTLTWAIPPLRSRLEMEHLRHHLDEFHQEYRAFLKNTTALLGIVLFTALSWGLDLLQPYLLFRALHVDVPFWLIVASATITKLMGIFSIIPGGAGLIEGMNFGLYAGLSSVPSQVIVAETILFRALDVWILWLGSGIATSIVGVSLIGQPGSAERSDDEEYTVQARHFLAHRRCACGCDRTLA